MPTTDASLATENAILHRERRDWMDAYGQSEVRREAAVERAVTSEAKLAVIREAGVDAIARTLLPTVWDLYDEYGPRLNPAAEDARKQSIAQAERVIATLESLAPVAPKSTPAEGADTLLKEISNLRQQLMQCQNERHAEAEAAREAYKEIADLKRLSAERTTSGQSADTSVG